MKKYLALVMALLLILVPFAARAEEYDDNEAMIFYDEEYEDDYDDEDYDDNDVEYYVEDYYDEDDSSDFDTVIMEADETVDLENNDLTVEKETCNNKVFTASNIIFLASGIVAGVGLTLIIQKATSCTCTCGCGCDKEEKKEKKTAKKNDK